MLIYAVALDLDPAEKVERVLRVIADWIGVRVYRRLQPADLDHDNQLSFNGGERVTALTATSDTQNHYAIVFRHPDRDTHGRDWVVEIGIDEQPGEALRVSVLLQTVEMSLYSGTRALQFSIPALIPQLFDRCLLSASTPGVAPIKELVCDRDVMAGYLNHIENPGRRHTVVVVSPLRDGSYKLDVELLRKQLLGVAEVVRIPAGVDIRTFSHWLPEDYYTWNGGINVIYPPNRDGKVSRAYLPGAVVTPESWRDVMARITHRSNAYFQSLHQSPALVLRIKRAQALQKQKQEMEDSGETGEYISLLEVTNAGLESQNRELANKVESLEILELELRDEIEQLQYRQNAMKAQLTTLSVRAQSSSRSSSDGIDPATLSSLDALIPLIQSRLGDRLILTRAAIDSMKDSPYRDIQRAWRAFVVLAGSLGTAIAGHGSLDVALEELRLEGISYAPKMSKITIGRSAGWERKYKDRAASLDRHLSLGSSRKPEACLRIHFEYDSDDNKVVVHHAGRHLDVMRS